ncbi:MAG: hypothetical protein LC687_04000 [Actinobacteria bacterium]|nr:hypothetical protein [Actinomycetota bacterium]
MPEWAKAKAEGDYTLPNASLLTRDGRVTGNSVLVGLSNRQWPDAAVTYLIVTDAGTILRLNLNELKEMFYPPEWVMKNLLPAHIKALEKESL